MTKAPQTSPAPRISFEFFPPKTPEAEATLWASIERLTPLAPHFVSVTYGAGGSTRERTHRTVKRILSETQMEPAAHLTCVGASRAQVDEVLADYWAAGVRHIVALRGDPPAGISAPFEPHPDGYRNATEVVAAARRAGDFKVSVAAYPEKHPASPSLAHDLDVLKQKVDLGATQAITQFFLEPSRFLRFRDQASAAGITIPILPGIMSVTNVAGLLRMAQATQTYVPQGFVDLFEGLDEDPETRRLVSAQITAEWCLDLQREGVNDFHFYTLNRAELTLAVCRRLGLKPQEKVPA